MSQDVDAFVEANIRPEQRAIVAALRAFMREAAPDAPEAVSYKMPVFVKQNIIAYINAAKTHVTFSFVRGVQIDDPYGLLKGSAKHARFVKLKSAADVERCREALQHYVAQALALDAV